MGKQTHQIDLVFNTNAQQAKAQIQDLSRSLQQVMALPGKADNLFDDSKIRKASQAALELSQHLNKAVNINTGKLDLARFSSSLKASNQTLSQYCNTLLSTGEVGQQAFLKLAQAIASADAPVARINKKLKDFGQTMMNTVKWQVSSSLLHGLIGQYQHAVGYAQDLNESLNDIRIVTGQNIDQMARFAKEANRAAKALSATTTEYTNASLIYYQQGLSDSEVAERAAVTVKLANVAGESAETASEQLTAVWNNFYDGSKSLEYYADVMTALGAATASSTEEISQGLNKFAAVADTVGLSYEHAAAALATVTATTRQSADVVGTAFKTLFARVQGLSLGETLDDGTTLNKYSQALASVGINIKDASGDLKAMDDILDELGGKWQGLSKDTQVALAQTVAGTRQYSQLVALMDNWSFFKSNLQTAGSASGTLDEQAEIYSESWEAARDRVKASAEDIYDSLLNDEFFIDLTNGFEKVLDMIGGLVDGLGGLKGVLGVVGSIFLKMYAKEMPQALNNLRQNFMVFTGQGAKLTQETQNELAQNIDKIKQNNNLSESYKIELEGIERVNAMKQKLLQNSKNMTQSEIDAYEAKIQLVQGIYKEIAALKEKEKVLKEEMASTSTKATMSGQGNVVKLAQTLSSTTGTIALEEKEVAKLTSDRDNLLLKKKKESLSKDEQSQLKELERQIKLKQEKIEELYQKAAEADAAITQLATASGFNADDFDKIINDNDLDDEQKAKIKEKIKTDINKYQDASSKKARLENLVVSTSSQNERWEEDVEKAKTPEQQKYLTEKLRNYTNNIKDLYGGEKGIIPKEAEDELNALITELSDVGDNTEKTEKSIKDLMKSFGVFANKLSTQAVPVVGELEGEIEDLEKDLQGLQVDSEKIGAIGQQAQEAADLEVKGLNLEEHGRGEANEDPKIGPTKISTALTELASAGMAAYATIQSITSAWNVLNDESASGMEKMGAILSVVTSAMATYNSVVGLGTTLKNIDTTAESKNILVKMANALSSKVAATAGLKLGAAKATETGAVQANTAAWYANPIMWIGLVIAGVVVALIALVGIIKLTSDALNKDAIAAENAEQAAKNLANAYNEAKESYQEMIEVMEEYETAREGLKELTKGTDEYREALTKANEAALELIRTNNLEKGKDYTVENGEIVFLGNTLKNLQNSQFDATQEAAAASTMANAWATIARNKSDQTDFIASFNFLKANEPQGRTDPGTPGQVYNGSSYAAASGAWVDPAAPGQKSYASVYTGQTPSVLTERDLLDKIIEEYKINGEAAFTKETLEELGFNTATDDYISELEKVVKATVRASEEMGVAAEAAAASVLSTNDTYTKSKYQEDITAAAGSAFEKDYNTFYNQYMERTEGFGSNITRREDFNAFAKEMKLTELKDFDYKLKANGDIEYTYRDDKGDKQKVKVTAEEIAAKMASVDATNKLKDSTSTLVAMFTRLEKSTKLIDKGFSALASGRLESATMGEADEWKNKNKNDIEAYVKNLSDDEIKALGYVDSKGNADRAAAVEAFEANRAELAKMVESISLPSAFNNFRAEMSMATAQALENGFNTANYGALGSEGGQKFAEGLNKMVSQITNKEDQQSALAQLASIDWSDWDAMEQAREIMASFGKTLEGQEWEAFTEDMRKANYAIQDFTDLSNKISKVYTLLEDLDFGKLIKEEDYQTLIKYNKAWEDFFILQADGSRRFIGNAKDMTDALKEDIFNQKEQAEKNKEIADSFNSGVFAGVDWGNESGYGKAEQLRDSNDPAVIALLESLGLSKGQVNDLIVRRDEEGLKKLYSAIGAFTSTDYASAIENSDEQLASTLQTLEELEKYKDKISKEAYEKQKIYLENWAKDLKRSDIVERYHEINTELERIERNSDKVNRAMDRLWGQARLDKMDDYIESLEAQQVALGQKFDEIKFNLALDQSALNNANKTGYAFKFNEDGSVANYTEVMSALYNNRAKLGPEEFEEQRKKLEETLKQYNETLNLKFDTEESFEQAWDDWRAANFEKTEYALEIDLKFSEMSMRELEYQLSKLEDDAYSMGEAISYLFSGTKESGFGGQVGEYFKQLDSYNNYKSTLDTQLASGQINQGDYMNAMMEMQGSIYDTLEALQQLDKQMLEYYGETLAAAGEEIDKYTERLAFQTSILDHYKSVMDIVGKSTDYKKMGIILEGSAHTIKNELDAAKSEMAMYQQDIDYWANLMKQATESGDDKALEIYKKNWEEAVKATEEAQGEVMQLTEKWAEALKAVLENELSDLAQTLEDALTEGFGGSFDQMTAHFERAASLQEEYLTSTNKIYETNKLMRTAQQELDKSTNAAAKQKLSSFISQTKELQSQEKLSNYELKVQQAKYDLLLAQIALEEAQNAKSTVRLQRDSEGNFGYVYTADSNAVADAQQKMEDAENALYNIGLEGANDYANKYQQTMNEMYDTLTSLQQQYLEGAFSSEAEYQAAVEEAKQFYYAKLTQYSSLYTEAMETDSRIVQDAWSAQFSNMVTNTEGWKTNVNNYVDQVKGKFSEWQKQIEDIEREAGVDLNNLEEDVKGITGASDNLKTSLGYVIDEFGKEGGVIDKVKKATEEYAKQRDYIINTLIPAYEALARAALEAAAAKSTVDNSDAPEIDDSHVSGGGGRVDPISLNGGPRREVAYKAFDTGGYTGEWGPNGKWAMLHEKELVLNKYDTVNFLSSVELLDKILSTIDLQSANAQLGGSLIASPSIGGTGSQVIEQHIEISASFPDATDRFEIEEAFKSMANLASQYANRK